MNPLAQRILCFIGSEQSETTEFNRLALDLFAYQYHHNPVYRRYCEALEKEPASVEHWEAIPAVPAIAFKRFGLSCEPVEKVPVVFHSSGTTGGRPSRHYMSAESLLLYRASLVGGFERYVLPDGAQLPIWAIMPPYSQMPHSSLSFMLQTLMETYPGLDHRWFWDEASPPEEQGAKVQPFLGTPGLAFALRSLQQPIILFGTAFAFVHFFEATKERFELPPGTRIVETGGLKGRAREVSREELYTLFTERLGVPPPYCLSEYGMTEMGSQFYDTTFQDHWFGLQREPRMSGVPWCRTRVEDPHTSNEVPVGEQGVLVHYDLANFNSVLAIRTEDVGVRLEEGFHLIGRAPGAEPRGCSLVVEERT